MDEVRFSPAKSKLDKIHFHGIHPVVAIRAVLTYLMPVFFMGSRVITNLTLPPVGMSNPHSNLFSSVILK